MIRSALIALGLSAGAASALFFGANAARAHGVVRAAPIVEVCGGTRAVQTEVCGDEVGGTPVDPSHNDVAEAQAVDVPVVTTRAVSPDIDAATPSLESAVIRVSLRCGAAPFHRDVLFQGTMDGSDPSAAFCP